MEIILKKEVANLGHADDIVKVKAGYALNYLIPQGYAILATESAKKQHAETVRQRAHKEAKLVADAEALAAKIAAVSVKVSAKVSENGKIYGSVTTAQLAEALVAAGVEVDKKDITILSSVKELGEYEAEVKCYKDTWNPNLIKIFCIIILLKERILNIIDAGKILEFPSSV